MTDPDPDAKGEGPESPSTSEPEPKVDPKNPLGLEVPDPEPEVIGKEESKDPPPRIVFVAGLPRSGSTLLMNILAQNPNHYSTPTSPLVDYFMMLRRNWKQAPEARAEGLERVEHRVDNILGAIPSLYFGDELGTTLAFWDGKQYQPILPFSQGKRAKSPDMVCFDKNRAWLNFIPDLERTMGCKVKVISTVRDVRDIACSFERLYRSRTLTYEYGLDEVFIQNRTREGRVNAIFSPAGVGGMTINALMDARVTGLDDRICTVPFKFLTEQPGQVMVGLHRWLGLPKFDYNFNNVKQLTHEDDNYYGFNDLHKIKPKVAPPKPYDWDEILGSNLAAELSKQFSKVNQLAAASKKSAA